MLIIRNICILIVNAYIATFIPLFPLFYIYYK